jgi:hypothetical protein
MKTAVTATAFLCVASILGDTAMAQEKPLKVFVCAGQSNMVGRRSKVAELPDELKGEQEDALFFNGRTWVSLKPGVTESRGFGPEISFAKRMSERLGEPVGVIKHSRGGSNLAVDWAPGRERGLYAGLLRKVRNARRTRKIEIVGMIWMQGGRDAKFEEMAKAYAGNLPKFIAAVRTDYESPDMIFISGRSSLPKRQFPWADLVRKAQQECKAVRYAWIDCDTVEKGPDNLHYNTAGYLDVGYRFAEAMLKMMK